MLMSGTGAKHAVILRDGKYRPQMQATLSLARMDKDENRKLNQKGQTQMVRT
jgi:hypothetical protein